MLFHPSERIGLFIDGPNFYETTDALGLNIDFRRFLDFFKSRAHLVRATYYTVEGDAEAGGNLRPLIDWLDSNGYSTVTKRQRSAGSPRRGVGPTDVELVVDVMLLAVALDHIVIVSGNENFRYLVAALQETGKRVSVLSTLVTRPAMVADSLRRQADQFIDLADLRPEIKR